MTYNPTRQAIENKLKPMEEELRHLRFENERLRDDLKAERGRVRAERQRADRIELLLTQEHEINMVLAGRLETQTKRKASGELQ